jgi:hypothetical protein
MGKSIVVFAMVALIFVGNMAWAEDDQELLGKHEKMPFSELGKKAEKYSDTEKIPEELRQEMDREKLAVQKELEEYKLWESRCATYKEVLSTTAKEGRFQACSIEEGLVFIIDTKEGHMWLWRPGTIGEPKAIILMYQGQLCPGAQMGHVIDRVGVSQ